MSSRRLERVNELLKHEIGEIIRRQFNIADTGLVSVNAVETAGDLLAFRQQTAGASARSATSHPLDLLSSPTETRSKSS